MPTRNGGAPSSWRLQHLMCRRILPVFCTAFRFSLPPLSAAAEECDWSQVRGDAIGHRCGRGVAVCLLSPRIKIASVSCCRGAWKRAADLRSSADKETKRRPCRSRSDKREGIGRLECFLCQRTFWKRRVSSKPSLLALKNSFIVI